MSTLDPYWAILSDASRRFGGWDLDSFMESGREVDALLDRCRPLGLPRARHDALDFGCGAGRLTQALARYFEHCLGIDVSEQMVTRARELAAEIENCEFAVHEGADLSTLPTSSFDLVLSRLVLQHIPGAGAKTRYIAEFVRVLRPGGLLAFQLPSRIPPRHLLQPRPRLYRALRSAGFPPAVLYHRLHLHPVRMTFLPRSRVLKAIEAAGGRTLAVEDRETTGGGTSSDYLVTKEAGSLG